MIRIGRRKGAVLKFPLGFYSSRLTHDTRQTTPILRPNITVCTMNRVESRSSSTIGGTLSYTACMMMIRYEGCIHVVQQSIVNIIRTIRKVENSMKCERELVTPGKTMFETRFHKFLVHSHTGQRQLHICKSGKLFKTRPFNTNMCIILEVCHVKTGHKLRNRLTDMRINNTAKFNAASRNVVARLAT